MSETASAPIRIGVSACLLGEKVRFDGGHKRDAYLVESFGRYVEWVSVCPEVELGLGTPRDTLRLVRISMDVRLFMPKTGTDHVETTGGIDHQKVTCRMRTSGELRVAIL
jgi:uncharacterized protein YbbK (DUF523 family)